MDTAASAGGRRGGGLVQSVPQLLLDSTAQLQAVGTDVTVLVPVRRQTHTDETIRISR